jgi:hypothetical protein
MAALQFPIALTRTHGKRIPPPFAAHLRLSFSRLYRNCSAAPAVLTQRSPLRQFRSSGSSSDRVLTSSSKFSLANSDPQAGLSTQISREKRLDYFRLSDHVSVIAEARYLRSQQI